MPERRRRRPRKRQSAEKRADSSVWWVYVIQSLETRPRNLPGFHYVGCTTDPRRRLFEHNGLHPSGKPGNTKGGRYTSRHRPWEMRALWGPYQGQSEALRAERALKKGKRGIGRCAWTEQDSPWCRGLGVEDPRVREINDAIGPFLVLL